MLKDINSKFVIALLLLSLIMLATYYAGLMDTQFDALDASLVRTELGANTKLKESLDIDGKKTLKVSCVTSQSTSSCGLRLIMSLNKEKGINLSEYKSVDLSVMYIKPDEHRHLRLYLKNYNPSYSDLSDTTTLKYNSVRLSPTDKLEKISVPMKYFQVATWWINKRDIDYEDAQLDVSNVPMIELSTGTPKATGNYDIIVSDIVFRGELISEATLIRSVLILWLIAVVFLLNYHRLTLARTANIDSLTGALNRRGLESWINNFYTKDNTNLVMYYIDIDDFKRVNDTYGHHVGDLLIKGLCANMQRGLKFFSSQQKHNISYCFARISGDEFIAVINDIPAHKIEQAALELLRHISEPIECQGKQIKINASIGVASKSEFTKHSEELLNHADAAMYTAKKRGKNQVQIFNQELASALEKNTKIAGSIRNALDNGDFHVEYMPIYAYKQLDIVGAEALIRCSSEELIGIEPDTYIPIAESYGLIKEIDEWVVEQVFKDIATVPLEERISYSINISSAQLHSESFLAFITFLLKKYNITPQHILLELTETKLVAMDDQSISFLDKIRSLGIRLALDDFGTGYTAFSQLLEYPIQYLKIDKSFVQLIGDNESDKAVMVNSILAIAQSYNLRVVAEGVETHSQLQYLRSLRCDYLQGYHLSKSMSWDTLRTHVATPSTNRAPLQ